MIADPPSLRRRLLSGAAALALQVALIAALVFGLRQPAVVPAETAITLVAVPPDPPPAVKIVPKRVRATKPAGRAAPPNHRARAAAIVAPPPIMPVPPPPIAAAVIAGLGSEAAAGAAPRPGPGSGAGGQGNGTGSGGAGDGEGGEIPLRHIRGRIRGSDYPRAALAAGASGVVYLRFVVGVDGRARQCRVTRSSGNADLDTTTCRLIEERFRYRPTIDANGRKVPDVVIGEHHWETGPPVEEPSR